MSKGQFNTLNAELISASCVSKESRSYRECSGTLSGLWTPRASIGQSLNKCQN